MQKVWMVWREVDFNQEWLEGVFASESLARKKHDELFEEWSKVWGDKSESPFSVSSVAVQGSEQSTC